ncbi:MAG TPA: hypothetical protein VF541_10785, partial [Longimicrobium sp.]
MRSPNLIALVAAGVIGTSTVLAHTAPARAATLSPTYTAHAAPPHAHADTAPHRRASARRSTSGESEHPRAAAVLRTSRAV